MPYIHKDARKKLDKEIDRIIDIFKEHHVQNCGLVLNEKADGEINYIITRLLNGIYSNRGYAEYNRAIGILECAKLEFYRRAVSIYEDKKIEENGDVYQ